MTRSRSVMILRSGRKIRPELEDPTILTVEDETDGLHHKEQSRQTVQQQNNNCFRESLQVAETVLKDFGATLVSYPYWFKGKGTQYRTNWRHHFRHILPDSPAKALEFGDNDVLVLLNREFLPSQNNTQVSNMFRALTADGFSSPLHMVIRRNGSGRSEWMSMNCILIQENGLKPRAHKKHKRHFSQDPEFKYKIQLKMRRGYLCVDNEKIHVRNITGYSDSNSILSLMKTKVVSHGPGYIYYASLQGPTQKYIGPNQFLRVSLLDKEFWYTYEKNGNDVYLMHKGDNHEAVKASQLKLMSYIRCPVHRSEFAKIVISNKTASNFLAET